MTYTIAQKDAKGNYFTAYAYGGPEPLPAPNPASFTQFPGNVTENDVANWYKAAMGDERVADIIKALDDQIVAKITAAADPSTPVPMALQKFTPENGPSY